MPLPLSARTIQLPKGPHRDLVYGKCRTCHDLQYLVDSKGITAQQWNGVLDDMKAYGLHITKGQRQKILDYLSTYLGRSKPPVATAGGGPAAEISGKKIFGDECSSCHQPNGKGSPGEFPPLAGNRDLFRTRLFPAYVVLNGLHGKIHVNGTTFNGVMPSFDFLSNAKIAAVINYVRGAWGNDKNRPKHLQALTGKDIAGARKRTMTPIQVHAYRAKHPL